MDSASWLFPPIVHTYIYIICLLAVLLCSNDLCVSKHYSIALGSQFASCLFGVQCFITHFVLHVPVTGLSVYCRAHGALDD